MLIGWAVLIGGIIGIATTYDELDPFPWETIAWGFLVGIGVVNALALLAFVLIRKGIERRTQKAAEEASRWASFRRFLNDFAGIPEAAPGSIEIWEQYLVYGIAFGVADRVLAAAQLHAPPELDTTSSIYWINPGGSLGSGRTAFAIGNISHAVAERVGPQHFGWRRRLLRWWRWRRRRRRWRRRRSLVTVPGLGQFGGAVLCDRPAGVVRHLPRVTVGIDEHAGVTAPEGLGAAPADGGAGRIGLGDHRIHFLG